jgi:hypothetical protein
VPTQIYKQQTTNQPSYDLFTAIKKYEALLLKNSRLFIVSDFLNTNDLFYAQIQKLKHSHLINFIRIIDPIEKMDITPGIYDISNGLTSASIMVDKKNQNLFKDFFKDKLNIYNNVKTKLHINTIEVLSTPNWYKELICRL